jgi:hypothetical protein
MSRGDDALNQVLVITIVASSPTPPLQIVGLRIDLFFNGLEGGS